MTELFTEVVDELTHDVEELFPPKPGGLVDKHRRRKAEEEAAKSNAEHEQEPITERSVEAVKVAQVQPEKIYAHTINIGAGAAQMILPFDPYRYKAKVLVVTASSNIVIAKDDGAAYSQNGFTLPSAVVFELTSRGMAWAYNPGGSTVQVSVLSEAYSPEAARR